MSDQFMQDLLRVSVGQICQAIGYNATQTAPLDLLQDILHRFLKEFAIDLRRQVEHCNRVDANFNDVNLTFRNLGINYNELLDYIYNVEPVPFARDIPKFPVSKRSNLSFLKPGSKEVLLRPLHIFEYLPPIHPFDNSESANLENEHQHFPLMQFSKNVNNKEKDSEVSDINNPTIALNSTSEDQTTAINDNASKATYSNGVLAENKHHNVLQQLRSTSSGESQLPTLTATGTPFMKPLNYNMGGYVNEEGRPAREIRSVFMTTGGFISPAVEGQLPVADIPSVIEKLEGLDAPVPTPPPSPSPVDIVEEKKAGVKKNTSSSESTSNIGKTIPSDGKKNIVNVETGAYVSIEGEATPLQAESLIRNNVKTNIDNITFTQNIASSTIKAFSPSKLTSKILKKAKKKPNLTTNLAKEDNMFLNMPSPLYNVNLSEKTFKKNMKILQKIIKTASSVTIKDSVQNLMMSSKQLGYLDAKAVAAIPPSPERTQINKLLKKQEKFRQKIMKIEQNVKSVETTLKTTIPMAGLSEDLIKNKTVNADVEETFLSSPNLLRNDTSKPSLQVQETGTDVNKSNILSIPTTSGNVGDKNVLKKFSNSADMDKNKLNIFKKISKQKAGKNFVPSVDIQSPASSFFDKNDGTLINLPSGTTITPTPALPKPSSSSLTTPQSNTNVFYATEPNPRVENLQPSQDSIKVELENKPKKRGRKPGSKNQPKNLIVNNIGEAVEIPNKKAKKPKANKPIFNSLTPMTMPMPMLGREPLNLTNNPLFMGTNALPINFSNSLALALMQHQQQQKQQHEQQQPPKKERKKSKTKIPGNYNELASIASTQATSGPLLENRNLFDVAATSMFLPTSPFLSKDLSNIQSANSKFKLPLLSTFAAAATTTTAATTSSIASGSGKKRNEQNQLITPTGLGVVENNMLPDRLTQHPMPLHSLYNFPSQPGLIPTPGLFPTTSVLGAFPCSPINSATTNLKMPNLLTFPNIKTNSSEMSKDKRQQHIKLEPNSSSFNDTANVDFSKDRGYCNVAPFVSDSMKLTASALELTKTSSMENLLPTLSKKELQRSNTNATLLPSAVGMNADAMCLSQFKAGGLNINEQMKTLQNDSKTIMNLPTETIEVSDDSDENYHLVAPTKMKKLSSSTENMPYPLGLAHNQLNSAFKSEGGIPMTATGQIKPEQNLLDAFANSGMAVGSTDMNGKETKKQKKMNKHIYNQQMFAYTNKISLPVDTGNNNAAATATGVGKLAGGADLIPLASTGHAYSSKSIPSTSLTAMMPTTALGSTVGTLPNSAIRKNTPLIFDNLTIAPATTSALTACYKRNEVKEDTIKKRKEHKKSKKLKEGKVKKKKDKKDKSKSKDRKLEKQQVIDGNAINSIADIDNDNEQKLLNKELTKKSKKDKKKEKQRQIANFDPLGSTAVNTNGQLMPLFNLPSLGSNTNTNLLSGTSKVAVNSSAFESNANNAASMDLKTSSSSPIPKLTLKLSNTSNNLSSAASGTTMADADLENTNRMLQKPADSSSLAFPATAMCAEQTEKRDPSPELARISPLITRPPKQKTNALDMACKNSAATTTAFDNSLLEVQSTDSFATAAENSTLVPPPSPWISGGTLSASSVLLPQQLLNSAATVHAQLQEASSVVANKMLVGSPVAITSRIAVSNSSNETAPATTKESKTSPVSLISETSRPSSYVDAEGNRVWICPACGKVDDGSAMIGCDGCDAWYHWTCVGITEEPANEDWFCRVCIIRKKGAHSCDSKKRKRNKKKC